MMQGVDEIRVAVTLEQLWHRVPGGTATSALGMVAALKGTSVRPIGVAAVHAHDPPVAFASPIEIKQLALPRVLLYESWHRLRRPRVESATGPVDVIHATTLAVPPRSAPLVVTIHDLAFIDRPQDFTTHGMRLFERGLKLARAEADVVIVPSEATRSECDEAGIDPERLRVVPWGVTPINVDEETVSQTIERFEITPPYVMWTGTLEPRKNLARLVEAFSALEGPVQLVLAGPRGWGDDEVTHSLGDRIRWLGFVAGSDLAALYRGAAVFCYPSLKEGFGMPVIEAMAQGTPTVTSRSTSTEEVAGDAALLVDPRDVSSITDALERALHDDSLRARLNAAGRERAATFTWARTASLVESAYREAMKAK